MAGTDPQRVGSGPLWPVNGPPPVPPLYGLLQAAAQPAAGVRFVPDTDGQGIDRWMNGIEVHPYPPGLADVWDSCSSGSAGGTKSEGAVIPLPQFGAYAVFQGIVCTMYQVPDQAAFKARAIVALEAVEGAAVAKQLMTGGHDSLLLSPHLSDGNGTFPLGSAATGVSYAIAKLEDEIAKSGKLGLIHCSPGVATIARERFAIDNKTGVIRTINGNVVIPDAGYVGGATPFGQDAPGANQEWMFATGPIDIRRTEVFTTPDNVAEALDRSINKVVYRAERYYVVDWDTEVQAAVLVDRCQTTC